MQRNLQWLANSAHCIPNLHQPQARSKPAGWARAMSTASMVSSAWASRTPCSTACARLSMCRLRMVLRLPSVSRGRDRTISRQCRRLLRQRAGRDHQRPLQDRGDQSMRPMAQLRSCRDGHPRMGRLVQQPPPARTHRQHSPPPKQRRTTMRRSKSLLWWRDSNQTASGKPGEVHYLGNVG